VAGCAVVYVSPSVRQLPGLITLWVLLECGFVGLCIAWGPAAQRRPRFWARVALTCLAIAAYLAVLFALVQVSVLSDGAASKLLPTLLLIGVGALICVPSLFYRKSASPPGASESDGGGGSGPQLPDSPFAPPRGGIPLLDADQASARARDHLTPKFAAPTRRRPAHEPRRRPVRTNE
jgi:hypothetical protein